MKIRDYGRCIRSDGTYLQTTAPGSSQIIETGRTTYQFTGKLTYLLDENNSFTLSGFGMPSNSSRYRMNSAATQRTIDTDDNIFDVIGRYGGKFLDKRLIVEAAGSWHYSSTVDQPTDFQRNTSALRYSEDVALTEFEPIEGCTSVGQCPVFQYMDGGWDYLNDQRSNRLAGKVSGRTSSKRSARTTRRWASTSSARTTRSTRTTAATRGSTSSPRLSHPRVPPVRLHQRRGATDACPAGFTIVDSIANTSHTTSTAVYLQDSWQLPVANVTLNAGIRWEGQNMSNDTTDIEGFSIYNNWAPRVQAIWDFTGNGRGKLAGSGPVLLHDAARHGRPLVRQRVAGPLPARQRRSPRATLGTTPRRCPATVAACTSTCAGDLFGIQVGGATPVHPDIQGVRRSVGGQAEYEVLSDFSVGVEYNGRRQGQTIEDMSPDDGTHYFIGNPGYGTRSRCSRTATARSRAAREAIDDGRRLSTKGVETFDPATGRTIQVAFPKPERSYDASRSSSGRTSLRTGRGRELHLLYLRGNLAGPYREEDGQIDPGITSEYDLASLTANRFGRLPGDRPHQVKLFGSYTFNLSQRFNLSAGAAYSGISATRPTPSARTRTTARARRSSSRAAWRGARRSSTTSTCAARSATSSVPRTPSSSPWTCSTC